jgi:hypothetical protein
MLMSISQERGRRDGPRLRPFDQGARRQQSSYLSLETLPDIEPLNRDTAGAGTRS